MLDIRLPRAFAALGLTLVLGACSTTDPKLPTAAAIPVPETAPRVAATETNAPGKASSDKSVDGLITKYSLAYAVPESLVRRVVHRESRGNPEARNGPYWGLMQLLPATARGLGHEGSAKELLDAETNLKYGVKYLAGAYKVADSNPDKAVRLYSRGYYYQAKQKGMLDVLEPSTDPVEPAIASATTQTATAYASTAATSAPSALIAPTQLAYANDQVVLPAVIPLPFERQDILAATMPATTDGRRAPAHGAVPGT